MLLRMFQTKAVLEELLKNGVAYSDPAFSSEGSRRACEVFYEVLGYEHHPFFLMPVGEDYSGTRLGNVNDEVLLTLDIPDEACARMNYFAYSRYLKQYIGEFFEVEETAEKIFISSDFPDEYANSQSRIALKGAVAKAKANASQAIPELIQIATAPEHSENTKQKHKEDAKYGWYRYHVRFALPVYSDKTGEIERYNIFKSVMLVRHAEDGKKYLYDFLAIKKETSSPLES